MKQEEPVRAYKISNQKGMEAIILDRGLVLQSLTIRLPNGEKRETVLGLPAPEDYISDEYFKNSYPYLGAFIGRYANRISGAKFTLADESYQLEANNGQHCLHGGKIGFDKRRWEVTPSHDGSSLEATYESPDGEEGFPGIFTCRVRICVTGDRELIMNIEGESDRATPVNLTWHPYFNLDEGVGSVEGHQLQVFAARYLPQDADLVPIGQVADVENTNLDYRHLRKLSKCISEGGMDSSFVINQWSEAAEAPAAMLISSDGKIEMAVSTDAPIVHVYTGQSLPELEVMGGKAQAYSGICLECQQYTDGINKISFPDTVLYPGQVYRQTIIHTFTVKQ